MHLSVCGEMEESAAELSASESRALAAWELEMIQMFVRAAAMVGLPRSVGEIYGCLYCADRPLSFDDLVDRLQISKGSVSQGLKLLRQLGAVHLHYVAGSRRDHYLPELSMRRLISGFFKEQVAPHIESGQQRLDAVRNLLDAEPDRELQQHGLKRAQTLETWQQRTRRLLPVIRGALGGMALLGPDGDTKRSTEEPRI